MILISQNFKGFTNRATYMAYQLVKQSKLTPGRNSQEFTKRFKLAGLDRKVRHAVQIRYQEIFSLIKQTEERGENL
jgi:uncharacterized Rossmann fold enzyme